MIRKEADGFVIYAEDGKKKLSKAYKTRGEAKTRLQQIEMFKHMEKNKNKSK